MERVLGNKVLKTAMGLLLTVSLVPAVSYAGEPDAADSASADAAGVDGALGVATASTDEGETGSSSAGSRDEVAGASGDVTNAAADAAAGQADAAADRVAADAAAGQVTEAPAVSDAESPAVADEPTPAASAAEPTDSALDALSNAEPAGAELANSKTPATPLPAGAYVVVPACSQTRCLDVEGASSSNGADVRLWSSNMTAAQRIEVSVDRQTGLYELKVAGTGKVLDVTGASTADGANVQQWDSNGTAAQKWVISANDDGTFTIESALRDGLVLDVAGAADRDGAEVDVWSANGTAAQRFSFLPASPSVESPGRTVEDGVYSLTCSGTGKALDVTGAEYGNGAALQTWQPNGTMAQMFRVTLESDGFYSIRAVHSGKALDCDQGNVVPGASVSQWDSYGARNQRWRIDVAMDGSWTLVNAANGLALDVAGASAADGARIQTWTANGTAAQSWVAQRVEKLIPDGYVSLHSMLGAHRVLDVDGGSNTTGANVQLWSWNGTPAQRWLVSYSDDGCITVEALCSGMLLTDDDGNALLRPANGSAAQRWRVVPAEAGGVALVSSASGKTLDVAGAGDRDGCNVQTYDANGTIAQGFTAESVACIGEGTYEVICASDGRALDVVGGSRANGANVQAWSANGSGAQKWWLGSSGDAWVLANRRSKKVLDVDCGNSADGTNVQQWQDEGNNAQRWRVEYAGGGTYRLVNVAAAKPLDVEGGGGQDGANVQVWSDNGTAAQRFRFVPSSYTPPTTGAVQRGDGSWDWYNDDGDWDRQGAIGKILSTANSLLGVPYVWLGVYPQDGGMDCASFTWYLYRQLGIEIGFETYDQMKSGVAVQSLSDAKPGDLILMYDNAWPNYVPGLFEHVVLYAGDGMIYEEPTFGGQCQYVSIYSKGMGNISIRRILAD